MSAFPTSVDEIRERVSAAKAGGLALQPFGGGTQLHIGNRPAVPLEPLPISGLNRVVDYTPDDMVVLAQAGITLAALQSLLATHGQWLPVECARTQRQTLGGIVSTRAHSACRAKYGSIRDWLIGIEVVGGDAQIVRGGGRVVKNVSGYDLPKLYCGAWGTLGIVTELAFKVAPIPEASATILAVLSADKNSEEALDSLLATAEPAQTALLSPAAAKALLGDDCADAQFLVVRMDGPAEAVAVQIARATTALTPFAQAVLELTPAICEPLHAAIADFALGAAPLAVEFHVLSSQVGAFARMIEWTARRAGFTASVVAECRSGVIHAQIEPVDSAEAPWMTLLPDFHDKARRVGGSYVVQRMPPAWTDAAAPVWFPVLAEGRLMEQIKRKLDPHCLFNTGRFAGGI